MSEIVLRFSAQRDMASRAIEWFTQGRWSHVDIVLEDGTLLGARSDSVGGEPPGVRIRPPDYASFARRQDVVLPCSQEVRDNFLAFARGQLGKPYDTTAIVAFVAGRNWQEADSWYCSELACAALVAAGYFLHSLATPPSGVTPDGLYLVLSALADVP